MFSFVISAGIVVLLLFLSAVLVALVIASPVAGIATLFTVLGLIAVTVRSGRRPNSLEE